MQVGTFLARLALLYSPAVCWLVPARMQTDDGDDVGAQAHEAERIL